MARNLIPLLKKSGVRIIPAIFIMICLATRATGQSDTLKKANDTVPGKAFLLQKVNRNGQVLPEVEIKEVTILARPATPRKKDFRRYERLVENLKKVYPYALIVRDRLSNVNDSIKNLTSDRERRVYLKKVERDVFAQYEGDIREMTITQGRLLIKLIDRETQNTSYVLIKEYRGGLAAAFWQGIARIFGTNLKEQYDPYGDDVLIESIVQEIEAGRL